MSARVGVYEPLDPVDPRDVPAAAGTSLEQGDCDAAFVSANGSRRLAPVTVVPQGRVAVGDEIGMRLGYPDGEARVFGGGCYAGSAPLEDEDRYLEH